MKKVSRENLEKMEKILAGHEKALENSLDKMEQTHIRLQGADREVIKKRFIFDITRLHDKIMELKGKTLWAKRLVEKISLAVEKKEQKEEDERIKQEVLSRCCMKGPVTYKPFERLKSLNA